MNVYILDENENPLPIGSVGLMWAGGACMSIGYLNLPNKMVERYHPDKFLNNEYVGFLPQVCFHSFRVLSLGGLFLL